MTATLHEILLTPDTKPQVTADCMTLIKQEVSAKSGVSGTTVKLAYKTVNAFASGYVQSMVETLLPDMIDKLEPYWAEFSASGAGDFGDYLVKRGDEVSESLLSVDGARAAGPRRGLRPGHDHQGLPQRPRQRRQARYGGASCRRRPGPEVRRLTAYLTRTSLSGSGSASTGAGSARTRTGS